MSIIVNLCRTRCEWCVGRWHGNSSNDGNDVLSDSSKHGKFDIQLDSYHLEMEMPIIFRPSFWLDYHFVLSFIACFAYHSGFVLSFYLYHFLEMMLSTWYGNAYLSMSFLSFLSFDIFHHNFTNDRNACHFICPYQSLINQSITITASGDIRVHRSNESNNQTNCWSIQW